MADRSMWSRHGHGYGLIAMNGERTRDPDRTCSAPGCTTVLSVYNSDHLCFMHADEVTRARFERRGQADPRFRYRPVEVPDLAGAAGAN
jgi:hypothetical protein